MTPLVWFSAVQNSPSLPAVCDDMFIGCSPVFVLFDSPPMLSHSPWPSPPPSHCQRNTLRADTAVWGESCSAPLTTCFSLFAMHTVYACLVCLLCEIWLSTGSLHDILACLNLPHCPAVVNGLIVHNLTLSLAVWVLFDFLYLGSCCLSNRVKFDSPSSLHDIPGLLDSPWLSGSCVVSVLCIWYVIWLPVEVYFDSVCLTLWLVPASLLSRVTWGVSHMVCHWSLLLLHASLHTAPVCLHAKSLVAWRPWTGRGGWKGWGFWLT